MDIALERRALRTFEESLMEAPDARDAWIAAKCGDDPQLREAVRALVDAARRSTAFPTEAPSARARPATIAPPERIGAYRLTERIGSGGMGDVWRAERDDGLFEQSVAVKLLRPSLYAATSAAYFDTERRVLARLRHRNIAQLYDGGADPSGLAYFVMELLTGDPIDHHVRRRKLEPRAIARLVIDVCAGVQHAHAAFVVHADIKPSNIIVDGDGVVKLLDFGIAQVLTAQPSDGADESGAYPLTPAYASPSRLAGERPTPSDDVFALGVMLYELLVGAPRDAAARLPLSLASAIDVGDQRMATFEGDLAFIVARATDPRPDHRYASASALATDLENWLGLHPLAARDRDWRYETSLFIRRHRWGVTATVAALVGLTTALVVMGVLYNRAEAMRVQAEQRFGEVRSLSKFQIFDLYDALAQTPGTTETRFRMARVAQGYLDRLARAPSTPPEVRLETAAGYIRLAQVQGVPSMPNLGDLDAARANLARADAMLAKTDLPGASLERAHCKLMMATIAIQSDQRMDAAKALVAEAERLLGAPTDPISARWLDTQQSLLLRQMEIADWEERYDDVRIIGAKSLAALDTWRGDMRLDDRYPVWRAGVLSKLGNARWYLGDREGGLQVFQSADALLREALVRMPNSTSLIKALIVNNYDVATTLDSLGQTRGAIPRMRESLAYGNRLLSFESRDHNLRRLMWRQQSALAQLLASTGQFRDALREETAVVAAKQAYRRAHPGEIRAERDLAFDTMVLGTINWRAGRRAEACRSWAEAEQQFLSLKTRGVLTPWDTSTQLGLLSNNLDVCARRKPASAIRLET
ncbi:MAG: Serine/threonine protein kinase bacterial [Caulobacteraceae bacterium]|nr:MAG: Serine/threonine protein kinase bacterial [Caulobacteraceae bacterium]